MNENNKNNAIPQSVKTDDLGVAAIRQFVAKKLMDSVSTKNVDGERYRLDREAERLYDEAGIKSRDIRVNFMKVGTYSVRTTKHVYKQVVRVTDMFKFSEWARDNADLVIKIALILCADKIAEHVVKTEGELPDGVDAEWVDIPERANGTTLRIDENALRIALGSNLLPTVAGLLGVSGDLQADLEANKQPEGGESPWQ